MYVVSTELPVLCTHNNINAPKYRTSDRAQAEELALCGTCQHTVVVRTWACGDRRP